MRITILEQDDGFAFTWDGEPGRSTARQAGGPDTGEPAPLSPVQSAARVPIDPPLGDEIGRMIDGAVQTLHLMRAATDEDNHGRQSPAGDPLERLGVLLFNQLLPAGLRAALRGLPPGTPLTLATGDGGLPWELLCDAEGRPAPGFLALRHPFGRRLLADVVPRPRAIVGAERPRVLIVANPVGDLPETEAEAEALLDLFDAAGGDIRADLVCRGQASRARLLEALSGGDFAVLHFAGHARPGALQLADGWLAADAIQSALHGSPLVFLNACASGRAGETVPAVAEASAPGMLPPGSSRSGLSRPAWEVGGHSLMRACLLGGASAVIGTLWPVFDHHARELAVRMYRRLLSGETLGEALRAARASARETAPGDPGWAAPVLYGDPIWRLLAPRASRHTGTVVVARRRLDVEREDETGTARSKHDSRAAAATEIDPRVTAAELRAAAAVIAENGGQVVRADETGWVAVFGVPQTLEDDAARALGAVLALRDHRAGQSQDISAAVSLAIGVASGPIWVDPRDAGPAPGPLYLGPALRQAAALAETADDGEIRAAPATLRLAGGGFEVAPAEPGATGWKLIGWRVTSPDPPSGVPPPTAGRAGELALLRGYLAAARAGRGSVVGIAGEAGIGKSHLVRALRQGADAEACRWVEVAPPTHSDAPCATVARVITALSGLGDDQARLLSAELPGRLVHLLRGLLAEASRPDGIVLVLDDAQQIDEVSLDILGQATEGIGRLGAQLIVLYRPDWAHPWFHKPDYRHLALAALDGEAQAALVAARLSADSVELPAGLETFLARAGGNPFYIEETLRWLTDTAALAQRAGRWVLVRPPAEPGLPDSIQRLLAARFDRLPPAARRVLDAAAVLGMAWRPALIERLLGGAELGPALAELEARGLVVAPWGGGDYAFRHGLVREAALASLPAEPRRALHRRAGRVLEAAGDPHDPGRLDQLARHWHAGVVAAGEAEGGSSLAGDVEHGDVERAIRYRLQAGAQANRHYAARRAAEHARAALDLLGQLDRPDPEDLAAAHEGLGDARNTLGEFEAAIVSYEAALALRLELASRDPGVVPEAAPATSPGPSHPAGIPGLPPAESCRRAADLARRIGRLHGWAARHEVALGWMVRGLAILGDRLDEADRATAALLHIHTGPIHFVRGEYELALGCVQRGLGIVEGTDQRAVLATGFNFLGAVQDARGDREAAAAAFARSLDLWTAVGDDVQAARVLDNLGVTCFHLGDWERAAGYHRQALGIFEEIEERDQISYACVNLGNVHLSRGEIDAAAALFGRARVLGAELGNPRLEAMALLNLGLVALERPDPAAARRALDASQNLQDAHAIDELQAETRVALGRLALGEGQIDAALDLAGRALAAAEAQQTRLEEALARRLLGSAHRARGDLALSSRYLRWSLVALEAAGHRHEAARSRVELALTARAAGRPDEATDQLDRAITAFAALGAALDLARARALRAAWVGVEVA